MPAPLSHQQTILWRVAIGLLYAFTLTVFVPWAPALPSVELDASWYLVLHWAFLNGLDFGSDIVFTYGPWGFLFQGYHPSTFIYSVIAWTFIATVCFMAMKQIFERMSHRRWVQGLMLFGFMALVGNAIRGMHDIRLFVTCWSLLLLHFHVDDRPMTRLKVAMVLALAIISLGKFSLALVAFLVVIVISIEILSRKIIPWLIYVYISAICILWLAAGQGPFRAIAFLRHSFQIASGYAQGVGIDSPNEVRDVLLYLLCAMGFLGVILAVHWSEIRRARAGAAGWGAMAVLRVVLRSVLLLGSLAAALFLCFKIGYIRHDEHELLATTCIAALAIMYMAVHIRVVRPLLRWPLIATPIVCTLLAVFSFQVWLGGFGLFGMAGRTVVDIPGATWDATKALVGSNSNRKAYDDLMQYYREFRPLPPATGTVDAYSWIQYGVIANGLEYRPRPVIQGYLSYAADLARINAEFLQDDRRAPESVYFDLQYIDGCYPTMAEAASIPELLGRYELKDATKGALLLTRSGRTRHSSRGLLQQTTAKIGDWIPVPPSGEPVWASIKLSPTLTGKLATAVYKPPAVFINVKSVDGQVARAKLIPGIASEGFLLSPLILDRMAFAILWSNDWKQLLNNLRITEIQVIVGEEGTSSSSYASQYDLTFEELRYDHTDIAQVPGIPEYFRFEQFTQAVQPMTNNQKLIVKNDDWRPVLLSPPPSRWVVDVPAGAKGIRISFGMLKEAWAEGASPEGANFRVYSANVAADGKVEAVPVYDRRLAPVGNSADRTMQVADVDLANPPMSKIILETDAPGGAPTYSYWADLIFR